MRVCCWLGLLPGLPGLPGCRQGSRSPTADGYARVAAPLPPALHQLLHPPTRRLPAADVAYLHAHQAQWQGDSLGRLLVHHRLGYDHDSLGRPDSLTWYLRQAWRAVGPAQRRQQPGEVVSVAQTMGQLYYGRGLYDSARACFEQGIATFRAAGLDSVRHPPPVRRRLPSGCNWSSPDLASCAAHLGLVSRSLGDLAGAVRYYERAALL